MKDLFKQTATTTPANPSEVSSYTAKDIEVLEGLEPVRKRPGMYVGGTDKKALHHLAYEVLDNSMDEAVGGHATRIEITLAVTNTLTIRDNGRGIPVDPHPKFPDKSALEVILTTLHSGGKFSDKAYQTAGGLHGVGISVVNALSDRLEVEVVREKTLWRQSYSRGLPQGPLENIGAMPNRRGTTITFHPDPEIFGSNVHFCAKELYNMAKSKAYLFRGVEIRWSCDPVLIFAGKEVPAEEIIKFPNGLKDYLADILPEADAVTKEPFCGHATFADEKGQVEWAVGWMMEGEAMNRSYCNTIPTPQGGTHETGLRNALVKGLRNYGEKVGNKRASIITADDVFDNACSLISLFIREPQFLGQTKEKLLNTEVVKWVESTVKDHFDHWLSNNRPYADTLLAFILDKAEARLQRKSQKETTRKTITQRIRLPGKLADCTREIPTGTEIFLVEGDSAGGSAKQARNRETQAILPLRGKILNVASSNSDKIRDNQELADLSLALGCGVGANYKEENLRYEKVIIMTDADVDGAHIAALLMTYFFQQMPKLVENGHLYLARPPLYRIVQGTQSYYARDDADKEQWLKKLAKQRGHIEISRFKGLGEMSSSQLKETTMDPQKRTLLQVRLTKENSEEAKQQVETLMGRKPELRFQFIQSQTLNNNVHVKESLDI